MAKQPKLILAPLSLETVAQAGKDTAKAIVVCEAAKARLLSELIGVANRLGTPLSAAQYDRQFAPDFRKALEASVSRGKLKEATAGQYKSKVKTAMLALLSGLSPIAGETFWDFYDRASGFLPDAKLADGSPVWSTQGKAGRPAGKKSKGKVSVTENAGLRMFSDALASAGDARDEEGGFDRRPFVAAALILAKGNEARAQRLVIVAESYPEAFDKWTASILTDADRAEVEARSAKAAKPAETSPPASPKASGKLDASFPETALAAALVKAAKPKKTTQAA